MVVSARNMRRCADTGTGGRTRLRKNRRRKPHKWPRSSSCSAAGVWRAADAVIVGKLRRTGHEAIGEGEARPVVGVLAGSSLVPAVAALFPYRSMGRLLQIGVIAVLH